MKANNIKNLSVSENTISNDVEIATETDSATDFETAITHTGYGRFNYLLLLGALPASCCTVFDTSVMAYVLPLAECDLNLSNFDKGVLNGGIYLGMICSAILWGFLSDKLGRRKLLVVGYLLDGICGLLSSISPTFWLLMLFKFLSGFIISGPFAVMVSYLAEFHSARYRARVLMFTGVYVSLAQTMVPVLAGALIPQTWSWPILGGLLTYTPWRCFVTVCAIPSLMAAQSIYFFDESPKFLMTSGRNDEALKVFRRIYSINTGKPPETFPVKMLLDEKKMRKEKDSESESSILKNPLYVFKVFWKQTKPLYQSPHLSRAVLIFTIQFGGMLAMNTVRLWLPQLFATMQEFTQLSDPDLSVSLCDMLTVKPAQELNTNDSTALTTTCSLGAMDTQTYVNSMIVALATGMSYLLVSYAINILGKKNIMIYSAGIAGVCGFSMYWSRQVDLTLTLLSLYLALGGICTSVVLSIVVDVFPTNIRTMAVSLTMMWGRIGSLLGNLVFPILLDLRCELPFLLVSGITICASLLSCFLPATMFKALE